MIRRPRLNRRHVVECPCCAGEGIIEDVPLSNVPWDTMDYTCPRCEGRGRVLVEVYEDIDGGLVCDILGPAPEEGE